MKKILLLLSIIIIYSVSINAQTLAYWRFEEGVNGVAHEGTNDDFYVDSSGNDFALSAWGDATNPVATSDIPFATVPLTGDANTLALSFDGTMNISTFSNSVFNVTNYPNGFTVELMVKFNTEGEHNAVVTKIGRPGGAADGNPTFTIKRRSDNSLQLEFFDGDNFKHDIRSAAGIISSGLWYRIAAVADTLTGDAKLYLQASNDIYKVVADLDETTDPVSGSNALFTDDASWYIGAGRWAGTYPSDFTDGTIDEVRISDSPLSISEFLGTGVPVPFLDITTPDITVNNNVEQYTVAGTNNENVVGYISWSNEVTSVSGSLPAVANWTIPNIALNVGANVIVVAGTNVYGNTSSDSVTIIRRRARGTEENPYTISEARALSVSNISFWAQGYIVGGNYNNFTSPFTNNAGVCCADSINETNADNCLQVTLDNGTGFPEIWGLQSHPENVGKRIKFHGTRGEYSTKPSFENVDQIVEILPESVLAYWRFEQGTNGMKHSGELDNWYLDSSSYANNLSASSDNENPYSTNAVPFGIVPATGKANLLAASFNQMAVGTYPTFQHPIAPINDHLFENGFTIECMVKYFSLSGNSVVVGNDANPVNSVPLFVLKRRAADTIQFAFWDNDGVYHDLRSTSPVTNGIWYYIAAVCDTSNAYLYIRTELDDDYQLEVAETNTVFGDSLYYTSASTWTVGRGSWGGSPTDFVDGLIDEVRIYDNALDQTQFLAYGEIPEPSLIFGLIALVGLFSGRAKLLLSKRMKL